MRMGSVRRLRSGGLHLATTPENDPHQERRDGDDGDQVDEGAGESTARRIRDDATQVASFRGCGHFVGFLIGVIVATRAKVGYVSDGLCSDSGIVQSIPRANRHRSP